MRRFPIGFLAPLLGLVVLLGTPRLRAEEEEESRPARLRLYVPANAAVEIEGVQTRQTGADRSFVTPPLTVGKGYIYHLKLTYANAEGKTVAESHKVRVVGGEERIVDLRPGVVKPPVVTEKKNPSQTAEKPPAASERPDVPYVPTPQAVVDKMLEMANVTDEDVVYDLGCGDGRILVTAAKKYRAKGVGIDINPKRVKQARENVQKAGVEKLVEIRQGNIFQVPDLNKATVVTLYLLPEVNLKLLPILQKQLKPGTRVVSHDFDMGEGWKPLKEVTVADERGIEHEVYLWMIGAENKGPIKKESGQQPVPTAAPKAATETPKEEKTPVVREVKKRRLDVPWVPTPQEIVERMLEVGQVGKEDVLYDLGCGDGRIVIAAARKFGCKAVGVDLDPTRVREARKAAQEAGVEKLVEIRQGDALQVADLGNASIVTLYLLPEVNLKLRPILQKTLKPGSRIVSHDYDLGDWKPEKKISMKDNGGDRHDILLWHINAKNADAAREPIAPSPLVNAVVKRAEEKDKDPDVIFVPTPQAVVDKMLEMAKVKKSDVVYDLGCGDGRIPVTAAKKFGCKGFGFDVDPQRIEESTENVKKNKVEALVTITKKDIFTLDLSPANVVTLYLLPRLNVKLIPQLEKLKPGSRIVSHDFDMEGVKPDEVVRLKAKDDRGNEREHTIYLFTVPLKKEKAKE